MRRVILVGLMTTFLLGSSVVPVFAAPNQMFFILPKAEQTQEQCVDYMKDFEKALYSSPDKSIPDIAKEVPVKAGKKGLNELLGCAIKSGNIHFNFVPFYIKGVIEFLLAISGLLSVLFIIYGGYQVLVGGLIEDKESGKKTITYAIGGLAVSFLAWSIVNIVTLLLTR